MLRFRRTRLNGRASVFVYRCHRSSGRAYSCEVLTEQQAFKQYPEFASELKRLAQNPYILQRG